MSSSPPPPPPLLPPYSSAATVGSNDDLLTEILSHLPVKPLLRFKTVNKQFNATITHPSFSLLHSLRHPHPPPSALFLRHHHPSSSASYSSIPLRRPPPPPPPPPSADIVQSSNGLFLSLSPSPFPSPHLHIIVSNPTTRSIAHVDDGITQLLDRQIELVDLGCDQVVGVSLGFDPSKWSHYYVIRVKHVSADLFMDVYDSRMRKWRNAAVCLDEAPFDTEFDRGVYWGGRVFWLSHTESMVYYDIENEVVGNLVLPKVFEQGSYLERFRYFGESCGHLHLIEIRTNCVREFDVLELAEFEGGGLEWFVKYRVDLDLVGYGCQDNMFQDGVDRFGRRLRFYAFSILAVVRGCADEGNPDGVGEGFGELVLSIPGKVISYDFKKRMSRLLCDVVDESDKWLPFRGYNAFQFIESLYSP